MVTKFRLCLRTGKKKRKGIVGVVRRIVNNKRVFDNLEFEWMLL